jgi:hypothetical protein
MGASPVFTNELEGDAKLGETSTCLSSGGQVRRKACCPLRHYDE